MSNFHGFLEMLRSMKNQHTDIRFLELKIKSFDAAKSITFLNFEM